MNFRQAARHLPSTLTGRDRTGQDERNSVSSEKDNDPPVEQVLEEAVEGMLSLCNVEDNCNELSQEDFEGVVQFSSHVLDHQDKTTKSNKIYARYQKMWLDFYHEHGRGNPFNDLLMKSFFEEKRKQYAPSTLWVIYSCINSYYIDAYNYNLNQFPRLTKYLKNLTARYVKTKSRILGPEAIHKVLEYCMRSSEPLYVNCGVGIALMYYGLLRTDDVKKINEEDVSFNQEENKYEVSFTHMRKRKNEGFTYTIPSSYNDLFKRYIDSLSPDNTKDSRFLKNYNFRSKVRHQPTGINKMRGYIRMACEILRIDAQGFTSHCWRRSAATNLADSGVSFINLKRHGQWASDAVVEGYIANSKPIREEREQCLLPARMRDNQQVMTPSVVDDSPTQKLSLTNVSVGISPEPAPTCSTQSTSTDVSAKLSVRDMLRRDSDASIKSTQETDKSNKGCVKDELDVHDSELLEDLDVQNHSSQSEINRFLFFDDEELLETNANPSAETSNATRGGTRTPPLVQNISNTPDVQRDSSSVAEILAPFRRASSFQNVIDISAEPANTNSYSMNQNQQNRNVQFPKQKFVFNNCTFNYKK